MAEAGRTETDKMRTVHERVNQEGFHLTFACHRIGLGESEVPEAIKDEVAAYVDAVRSLEEALQVRGQHWSSVRDGSA